MEEGQGKVSRARNERTIISEKSVFNGFPMYTKRHEMPSIIRKMARDRRKSIIGEIARREQRGMRFRFKRMGIMRKRFMAP